MRGGNAVLEREQPKKRDGGSGASEAGAQIDYGDIFADLSYWYHLPYSEIRIMPMSAIQCYMERLPKLQAKLRLMLGEAATVPHMEQDARQDWARDLSSMLDDGRKRETPPPAVLRARGVGVQFVQVKHG